MGVYSLEAAEMYAAKNKPALNESFEPYENPVLEYGIRSIRADFALFEAQLELDFKEYYDTLNEADDNKDNKGITVNVNGGDNDPEFDVKKQKAQDAYDKEKEDKEKAEDAEAKAAKKAKVGQALGKLKIDSGTIAKLAEVIKNLWKNFVASIKSLFNRLIGSFNQFTDNNGEKFKALCTKLQVSSTVHNYKQRGGKELQIIDPSAAKADMNSLIAKFNTAFKDKDNSDKEAVDNSIRGLQEELEGIIQKHNSNKASADDAVKIILGNKDILKTFTNAASAEFKVLSQFGEAEERKASQEIDKVVRSSGQEEADKNVALQVAKENAQKISQFGAKLGAEYGKLMSSAVGSIYKCASSIVSFADGTNIGSKVKATKDKIAHGAKLGKKVEDTKAALKGNDQEESSNKNNDYEEDYENVYAGQYEESAMIEDDLLTEAETAIALQAMVEDVCDINFNECFEF